MVQRPPFIILKKNGILPKCIYDNSLCTSNLCCMIHNKTKKLIMKKIRKKSFFRIVYFHSKYQLAYNLHIPKFKSWKILVYFT